MSLPNRWHLRKVAEASGRSCMICYKPSSSVLITPDNKDYFYICPIHLKDKGFCSPIIDEEEVAEKKKREEMDREIEKVKREYEEKQRRKKEKQKEKDKEKDENKDKKDDDDDKKKKGDDEEQKKDEKEKNDKIKAIESSADAAKTEGDDSPRIYSLHKNFYQMRVERIRTIEASKRNQQRLRDANFFPSTPKSDF